MGDTHKPRHIRDIAHLYLSTVQSKSPPPCVTLLTAGEDKRCFSGFHAANLAAALSAKGNTVHVFDRSGLLPNTGFFMCLPPRRYLGWEEDEEAPIPGLGGVKISHSHKRSPAVKDGSRQPRVELVHLPPLLPDRPFQKGLQDVRNLTKSVTIVLVFRIGTATVAEVAERVAKRLRPAATCVLYVGDAAHCGGEDDPSVIDLGSLVEWESALGDRVPAVIRAPDSALSRAYYTVCESLLFKINQFRRKAGGARRSGISA